MSRFINLLILTTITCLNSCTPKSDEDPKIIKISEADMVDIPLEQILSGSEFTPLEFTPESALAESAMFLDCKSGYFLMDKYEKKVVYQFDQSGLFIRTIGQPGKGPGEYTHITDALMTEKGLEILTGLSCTEVYQYNKEGLFIRSNQVLPGNSQSFAKNCENGNYYFKSEWYQHLIQQVDAESRLPVDSFIVRNPKLMGGGVNTFSSTAMGTVLFYQLFDNRIFEIVRDTAIVRYLFDAGASTPNYDELNEAGQTSILNEGIFWYIYKALENTNWLYLLMSKQDNMDETQSQLYGLLYEKKTAKLYRLPETPEPWPLFHPAFALDENDILYTAVQPVNIYESAGWKGEFTKRNIPLTPDGNFIVVKIPLGKIIQ